MAPIRSLPDLPNPDLPTAVIGKILAADGDRKIERKNLRVSASSFELYFSSDFILTLLTESVIFFVWGNTIHGCLYSCHPET